MDRAGLLAAYDRDLRRDAEFLDTRRERHGDMVTHTSLVGGAGCVLHGPGPGGGLGDRIRGEVAYFESIGQDFDWVCFEHDPAASLLARLLPRYGFQPATRRAVWVRDTSGGEPGSPVETRQVAGDDDVAAAVGVQERVRGRGLVDLGLRLREAVRDPAQTAVAFLGLRGGTPVGSGWVTFGNGSSFGSLAGGGVLPEHRGHGAYRALLGARIRAAAARGAGHVIGVAGPGGEAGLDRHGFRRLTGFTRFRYAVTRPI